MAIDRKDVFASASNGAITFSCSTPFVGRVCIPFWRVIGVDRVADPDSKSFDVCLRTDDAVYEQRYKTEKDAFTAFDFISRHIGKYMEPAKPR